MGSNQRPPPHTQRSVDPISSATVQHQCLPDKDEGPRELKRIAVLTTEIMGGLDY